MLGNWPARCKQCVLTSSRGLSDSSSGTVVVLLSLAVAADAGDIMTAVQKPGHGSPNGMGVFQIGVKHKDSENLFAHHPKESSPAGAQVETLKRCIIPASSRWTDVAGYRLRESGHCASVDAQNRLRLLPRCNDGMLEETAARGAM